MLNVIMLIAIMQIAIMLNVVAPCNWPFFGSYSTVAKLSATDSEIKGLNSASPR